MNFDKFEVDDQLEIRYDQEHPGNDPEPLEVVVTKVNPVLIEAQCCFVDARVRVWGDGDVETSHGRSRGFYQVGENATVLKKERNY